MVSVEWVAGKVRFIDQTKLPGEEVYVETSDYRVVGEAIKRLQIRGAPAIGVAAAFAVLLAVDSKSVASPEELQAEFYEAVNYLTQTRPTAINLAHALKRMRRVFEQTRTASTVTVLFQLLQEARAIQREDAEACRLIADYGSRVVQPGSSILTHCNTGALATAGSGTALGVIMAAARENMVSRVFVTETRPLLQGARLTAWELVKAGVETVLVTDSTAAVLLAERQVNAIMVGADRIATNGDTANKIGTYSLASLASRHKVPFYVVAPTTTIDFASKTGREIPIEQRDPTEITHVAGIRVAPKGVKVFAPAFDVTPADLITAIITEAGVLQPPFTESIAGLRQRSFQSRPAPV